MNKRHYEHTLPNIRGSLSNTYDYLRRMGFNPVKQQGDSIWYCSPFREEKTPSFKVSASRNL